VKAENIKVRYVDAYNLKVINVVAKNLKVRYVEA